MQHLHLMEDRIKSVHHIEIRFTTRIPVMLVMDRLDFFMYQKTNEFIASPL